MTFLHQLVIADHIYTLTTSDIRSLGVECPEQREFHQNLCRFERLLGDEGHQDPYWQPVMRFLRRIRFNFSAAPIQFDDPAVFDASRLANHRKLVAQCHLLYPDLASPIKHLFDDLDRLIHRTTNPLVGAVTNLYLVKEWPIAAVLLAETRLIPAAERMLRRFNIPSRVEVIGPTALSDTRVYEEIIIIGPPRWFPAYIFNSPRAGRLTNVAFSWLHDKWEPHQAFLGSNSQAPGTGFRIGGHEEHKIVDTNAESDIRPIFAGIENLDRLLLEETRNELSDREVEQLEMELFLLEGELAVFLDVSESARALVIDLDEDNPNHRVRRIPVEDIDPGMFLLLRTYGEGDYILPLADRLLGASAQPLRRTQEIWKGKLRGHVIREGLCSVCVKLGHLGALRANESNVRNWMWPRSIRPQADADFLAILHLIGLQDRFIEIRQTAGQILRAHMRAGAQVRRQLLEQVRQTDLHALKSLGYKDFAVSGLEGVALSAIRVTERSGIRRTLPARRAGNLIDMEGGIWRG